MRQSVPDESKAALFLKVNGVRDTLENRREVDGEVRTLEERVRMEVEKAGEGTVNGIPDKPRPFVTWRWSFLKCRFRPVV